MEPRPDPITLRVFVSSPGDVQNERQILYDEIRKFSYSRSSDDPQFYLQAVGWDRPWKRIPIEANRDPQSVIDERMLQARECDIALFVFWSRIGTELDPDKYIKPDAYQYDVGENELRSQYFSGTEFEFVSAIREAETNRDNFPHIFVFHRSEKPKTTYSSDDSESFIEKQKQLRRLIRFLNYIEKRDEEHFSGSLEKYETDQEFRESVREILHEIVSEIAENSLESCLIRQKERIGDKRQPWPDSPFPGLISFEEKHERIYFGRSKELVELLSKIRDERFVAVIGASGSGKSSLVRAGLIPALKRNAIISTDDEAPEATEQRPLASSQWKIITMKPGEVSNDTSKNPFDAFIHAIGREFGNDVSPQEIREIVESAALALIREDSPENTRKIPWSERRKLIRGYQHRLAVLVDSLLSTHEGTAEILLLIDQFEELFTVVTVEELRAAFLLFLQQLTKGSRSRVLITTRADLYHYYVQHEVLVDMLKNSMFNLAPPGLEALSDMICCPAAEADLKFEENVAQRILVDTHTDDNSGALPLMAYLLDQMYSRCRGTGKLTMKAYEEVGGVAGAIARSAEQVISELQDEYPAIRKTLQKVFRELVELNDIGAPSRRRANKLRLITDDASQKLVNRLIDARLLVSDRRENKLTGEMEDITEVSHEALLLEWSELKKWINDNEEDFRLRKKVEEAAAEWRRHHEDRAFSWNHEQLLPFYEAMERMGYNPESLDGDTLRFIEPEVLKMIRELENTDTSHLRRSEIGIKMGDLGDPRYGVGVDKDKIPQIAWCSTIVPAGEVRLEGLDQLKRVQSFYIAKYPVTLAQFNAFVESPEGYNDERWWVDLGKNPGNHQVHDQTPAIGNHPAVWVSWYQAIAFCRWLSYKVGYSVRIPYEWEWQQAATGGDSFNYYPWGSQWDKRLCNSYESGLNSIVSVGLYPAGKSPIGAEDLAGNVVEWCLNSFESPSQEIDFLQDSKRTTRGGAYFLAPSERRQNKRASDVVKTTNRLGDNPDAPASGQVRVAIRLVADNVPAIHLQYPELNELMEIPESIRNYYVDKRIG